MKALPGERQLIAQVGDLAGLESDGTHEPCLGLDLPCRAGTGEQRRPDQCANGVRPHLAWSTITRRTQKEP
jgi:hypothetical protein